MTPLAWFQLGVALIQAVTSLVKDAGSIPADLVDAKAKLHAVVEALDL